MTRICGAGPWPMSHSAGAARRSPSRSRAIISARTTPCRRPGLCKLLRLLSMAPSASRSFSMRLRAILAGPLTLKARAISRLPILPSRLAAEGFALAGDEGQDVRAGGQSFIARLVRRLRGFGDILAGFSAHRRIFSRLLSLPRFLRRRLWPPVFVPPPLPLRLSSARPAWFFWPAILSPAPFLSSIKRIASSSVIVSGDMPPFKVALVLPRLT